MHPPLKINTIYNTSAWHTAGRFASCYYPGQIHAELTKVNKPVVISCMPISCKEVILLLVKPGGCNLQKQLTKWPLISTVPFTYQHIILVTYYPFTLLTYYHINSLIYNVLTIFQVISRGQ